MEPINGRTYPLWGQFIDRKNEWIGGTMQEFDRDCGEAPKEKITDISMRPNGDDSAFFEVSGETYSWGADVSVLGVNGSRNVEGGIALCAPYGSELVMKKADVQRRRR